MRGKRIICLGLVLALALSLAGCKPTDYKNAMEKMASGSYAEAAAAFTALGDYKDSAAQATECNYRMAEASFKAGDYEQAIAQYAALDGYKDSASQMGKAEDLRLAAKLVGDWTADLDMTEMIAASINETVNEDVVPYFHFPDFVFPVTYTFTEKGTFSFQYDETVAKDFPEKFMNALRGGMIDYLTAELEAQVAEYGLTLENLLKESGVETVEEIFQLEAGMSIDEMLDQMGFQDFMQTVVESVNVTGVYAVEGGEITLTAGTEEQNIFYDEASDTFADEDEALQLVFTRK